MVNTVASNRDARRRIVVAGEMLELGPSGPELHREAGRQIALAGIDRLVGVRGLARELVAGAREAGMTEASTSFFDSAEQAAAHVQGLVQHGDLVLVKASRGVKAEAVVQRLKRAFELKGESGVAERKRS
jgi:UDP-N-acetylmuramoyl-tripeptide--D-alanyl-D-alanine ligase